MTTRTIAQEITIARVLVDGLLDKLNEYITRDLEEGTEKYADWINELTNMRSVCEKTIPDLETLPSLHKFCIDELTTVIRSENGGI